MNAAIELDLREFSTPSVDVEVGVDAKAKSHTGRWLRYRVDRRAVAYVHVLLGLHAAVFFLAPTWVAGLCVIPLATASMFVAAINHHHQHFNTFHSSWMNRVFDITLSLQTGIAPFAWVLHHNLGHHVNYLKQRPTPNPTSRDGQGATDRRWVESSTRSTCSYAIRSTYSGSAADIRNISACFCG